MIREIYSPDLRTFKRIQFHGGMNILLAERAPESSEKQTRNSVGKSSIVDHIHFCLGSDATKDDNSSFASEALREFTFGMRFDLAGETVTVERTPSRHGRVRIVAARETAIWPRAPFDQDGARWLRVEDWRVVLGRLFFDLKPDDSVGGERPTVRNVFPYFARRERDGGFQAPARFHLHQKVGGEQVSLSFLLGLDWTLAHSFQGLRDRREELNSLKRQMADGALKELIGNPNDLRRELALAQQRLRRLRADASAFRILEQYHSLEEEASRLSGEIQDLAGASALDLRLRDSLQAALTVEAQAAPSYARVRELWELAGVVLPDAVRRRYEEVQAFHESVITNRRTHLAAEITAAATRVAGRRAQATGMEERQQQIMSVLKTHGALDQFNKLQEELGRAEARAESLRTRYELVTRHERLKAELEIDQNQLLLRLQSEIDEQAERVSDAIVTYEALSATLSDHVGTLNIQATKNGPAVQMKTQGDRGAGIRQMQVFCFDMVLVRLWTAANQGPGFLVHDSHLFDGMDSRQVSEALRVAAVWAEQYGFQYIVTMNSDKFRRSFPVQVEPSEPWRDDLTEDVLPRDATPSPADVSPLPMNEGVENSVLSTVLDDRPNGGLFGFRFD